MIYAAIAAGGVGSRMGADIPKQFLKVGGVPMIVRTISRFCSSPSVDAVYVGTNAEWVEELKAMCAEYLPESDNVTILAGGADRNGTVFKIAERIAAERGVATQDIILTHDGVRPFVTERIIADNIAAMRDHSAAGTAVPSVDTILLSSEDGGVIESVPPRARMFRAQTPQTFRLKELMQEYAALTDEQKARLTDTAGIFALRGIPVAIVRGEDTNIKITAPFDMQLAELIAAQEK